METMHDEALKAFCAYNAIKYSQDDVRFMAMRAKQKRKQLTIKWLKISAMAFLLGSGLGLSIKAVTNATNANSRLSLLSQPYSITYDKQPTDSQWQACKADPNCMDLTTFDEGCDTDMDCFEKTGINY